jgi:hypothetical protein
VFWAFVRDVHAVAADEMHTKHNVRHPFNLPPIMARRGLPVLAGLGDARTPSRAREPALCCAQEDEAAHASSAAQATYRPRGRLAGSQVRLLLDGPEDLFD